MCAPVQSNLLDLRQISHDGGSHEASPHRRSTGRLRSRRPAWNLCPLGNLRVRVCGGSGGAAGAPEDPAPPPACSSQFISCSSSSQAASDAAARLARRIARSSSSVGCAPFVRVDGVGGRATVTPGGPASPPSRCVRIVRSPLTRMRRRGCSSSGCTSPGAAAGLLVDEDGASPGAAAGLLIDEDGGVATPPYFDRVDTELVDAIEGPSLGEGGMPSLGESHSSGKRGPSSTARGPGDLERSGTVTVRPSCAAWRRRRRSRLSVLSCRRAAATALAIRSSTRASTEGHIARWPRRSGPPPLNYQRRAGTDPAAVC